jgi:group I intron endonuclease
MKLKIINKKRGVIFCGIYSITNNSNGYVYIGSSKNIKRRFYNHNNKLKRGVHENIFLQKEFIVYGDDNFIFDILMICEESELYKYEEEFLKKFNLLYNIQPHAGTNKGYKHKINCKIKLSIANSGVNNGQSKLTKEQVLEIRNSTEKGIILSKRFNISTSQISMVKNNKSYKNI